MVMLDQITKYMIVSNMTEGMSIPVINQVFHLTMKGYAKCRGHIQCDSIIMGNGHVSSVPEVAAFHSDAQLIHEAAIGKIASEQLIKLMTLGLTEEEAEETILKGFLK